jgi:hypothetical protein
MLLVPTTVRAERVSLAWDANPETDLLGYRIHYGTQSGVYTTTVDVGNRTAWVIENLTGGATYYFAVQAYNTASLVSPLSSELSAFVGSGSPTQQLTVTRTGGGAGVVTSSPAGIACGGQCTQAFAQNSVITLIATAGAGSAFSGWGGDSDCADGVVSLSSAKTCSALFSLAGGDGLSPVPGSGTTTLVSGRVQLGKHDVAFDAASNSYLVVWNAGKRSQVKGVLLDSNAQPIGNALTIGSGTAARVTSGDGSQSFLVTYTRSTTAVAQFVTIDSFGGVVVGPPITVASWRRTGGAGGAVYVPDTGQYLVTWWTGSPSQSFIRSLAGDGSLGAVSTITATPLAHSAPAISCGTASCLVAGQTSGGKTAGIWARSVNFDGTSVDPMFIVEQNRKAHAAPRVAYSATSDTFLVGWIRGSTQPVVATVVAGSSAVATVNAVSTVSGSNSTLAYNPSIDKFAFAAQGRGSLVWAHSLNSDAVPSSDPLFTISGGRTSIGMPAVAANPTLGEFLIVYRAKGTTLKAVRVQ